MDGAEDRRPVSPGNGLVVHGSPSPHTDSPAPGGGGGGSGPSATPELRAHSVPGTGDAEGDVVMEDAPGNGRQ